MKSLLHALAFALAMAFLLPAQAAEGVLYVTDRLLADLHPRPDAASEVLMHLPTGTPLEVSEFRDGFAHVSAPGEHEGWVSVKLLTEHEPALAALFKLTEERQRDQTELERLRERERDARIPLWLAAAAGSVALLIGFVFGVAWLDHRVRERHGGFRV